MVLVLFLFKSGPFARRLATPQSLRTTARALPAA
jgi:hypothetical protein